MTTRTTTPQRRYKEANVMYRIAVLVASLLLASPAFAGQPLAAAMLSTASPSAAAAADKVYPPLPTLAMLPPSTGDDDEPLVTKPTAKKRKTRVPDIRPTTPAARLVVSDTSRAYLKTIDRQLDLALAR
ncbi:hypothetical protein [Paraburkholderia sp. GAS42]|uniref:hypothetical protein n=1 Tax=Paraburkholderia sp. GAS42 TaxID=3035135 RepID=UPI003D1AC411